MSGTKPDFYQGPSGYWHFHSEGYTSGQYQSYEMAKMGYAAWALNKQLREVFSDV